MLTEIWKEKAFSPENLKFIFTPTEIFELARALDNEEVRKRFEEIESVWRSGEK